MQIKTEIKPKEDFISTSDLKFQKMLINTRHRTDDIDFTVDDRVTCGMLGEHLANFLLQNHDNTKETIFEYLFNKSEYFAQETLKSIATMIKKQIKTSADNAEFYADFVNEIKEIEL